MAEQPTTTAGGSNGKPAPAKESFLSQVSGMVTALWTSHERNAILLLSAALVAVVGATAYAQVRLNAWNQPFYNSLSKKDFPRFYRAAVVFAELASVLLVLNVAQMWLNQTAKVGLREGLVNDLMNQWLAPTRAFRLSNAGEIGANPDQRLQQDAQHLTDLTTDLGIGLLQSTLLLLCFIGVLWVLSGHMFFSLGGHDFSPPGYMVWCALLYAGLASLVSWWVGRPLDQSQRRALCARGGVPFRARARQRGGRRHHALPRRGRRAAAPRRNLRKASSTSRGSIVSAVTRLTWVTAGYGWFTIAAPILVAAPAYFSGSMTFGELMMIVGAFNQVQTALRWYVDNFSSIADWRATLLRVAAFRTAIIRMDDLGQSDGPHQVHRRRRIRRSRSTTSISLLPTAA